MIQPNHAFYPLFRRRAGAVALVKGSPDYPNIRGRILFFTVPGGVTVFADVSGLPAGTAPCDQPIFAFHIHDGTACSGNETDPFADAGSHYDPGGCPHPSHAGDLPPLFGANGRAVSAFLTNRFTVRDVIGKAVIIHRSPDDFTSQPAGRAGEKIACGIITRPAW